MTPRRYGTRPSTRNERRASLTTFLTFCTDARFAELTAETLAERKKLPLAECAEALGEEAARRSLRRVVS